MTSPRPAPVEPRHAADLIGRPWDSTPGRVALALTAVGIAGFTAVLVMVTSGWQPLIRLDSAVAVLFDRVGAAVPAWVATLRVIELALTPLVLRIVTLGVAVGIYRSGLHRVAWWLAGTVAGGWLVQVAVKEAVRRPRPEFGDQWGNLDRWSFPSGHALTSVLLAGALLFVALQRPNGRRYRGAFWTVAVVVVLVVGLDRVGLVVHHVSDVLAGWFLALCLLGVGMLVFGVTRPGHLLRSVEPDPTHRPRVAVVANPSKIEGAARFRRRLADLADAHGWDTPIWLETSVDDAGHSMTRRALESDVDLVIAAGGDGTVRVVCAEMAGSGVPIGIVPVGTGNLLARNLGLPLDHEDAIEVALTGQNRPIDIVRVDGDGLDADRFAVMAGLGLDAAVVGEAPDALKARVGWAAYVVSIAGNLSFPAVRVRIQVDDEPPVRLRARTVIVGNVGHLHGGLPLLPFAAPDDGLLDVTAIAPRRVTAWPRLVWRVLTRSRKTDDQLSHWRGRRVVVHADEPMPRQLDGDVVPSGHELRAAVEPGQLLVRMPATVSSPVRAVRAVLSGAPERSAAPTT